MSREIHRTDELEAHIKAGQSLTNWVIQGIDCRPVESKIKSVSVNGAVFLGCTLSDPLQCYLMNSGALVFPGLGALPFDPYRPHLYTPEELFEGFSPKDPCSYCDSPDAQIYSYWQSTGGSTATNLIDTLARRLHDLSITDAIQDYFDANPGPRVAIMGGHSLQRDHATYATVAHLSQALAQEGYLILTGGGPGAMEAAHLGVWFRNHSSADLDAAIGHLSLAPSYKDKEWLVRAFEVRERWPVESLTESLGIPTWLYGHEPPNAFARHHAKYFANSVREDGLVSFACHGIIFAQGAAGTVQEIFQDATQNYYGSMGEISPMVLIDSNYWNHQLPVVPLLQALSKDKPWAKLWTVLDRKEEVLDFMKSNKPVNVVDKGWSFCREHCGDTES